MRGNAARQLEEALQPVLLAATIKRDVLEALRLADHGADRDHQDVEQLVLDPPVAAWVLDLGELADQRLEHGFLLLARGEAYPGHGDDSHQKFIQPKARPTRASWASPIQFRVCTKPL